MKTLIITLLLVATSQLFADTRYLSQDVSVTTDSGIVRVLAGSSVEVDGNTATFKDIQFPVDKAKFTTAEDAAVLQKDQQQKDLETKAAIAEKQKAVKDSVQQLYKEQTPIIAQKRAEAKAKEAEAIKQWWLAHPWQPERPSICRSMGHR